MLLLLRVVILFSNTKQALSRALFFFPLVQVYRSFVRLVLVLPKRWKRMSGLSPDDKISMLIKRKSSATDFRLIEKQPSASFEVLELSRIINRQHKRWDIV